MKIFLATPKNDWIRTGANRREWERFLENFSASAPPGSVVSDPSRADVVIHNSNEQFGSAPIGHLIKPLNKRDISHVVWDWGDRPTGRYSGFYCSLPMTLYDSSRHRTFVYPLDFNELIQESPQSEARYDFGFMGGLSAAVRGRLFRALEPRQAKDNSIIRLQGANWRDIAAYAGGRAKEDYASLLRSCKFMLCPRGYGLGTVRLFETMKAGRVPIIVSDGYVPPAGVDWSSCALVVAERDIDRIPQIVQDALDDWPRLAAAARSVWLTHFAPGAVARYMVGQLAQLELIRDKPSLGQRYGYPVRATTIALAENLRPLAGRVRAAVGAAGMRSNPGSRAV